MEGFGIEVVRGEARTLNGSPVNVNHMRDPKGSDVGRKMCGGMSSIFRTVFCLPLFPIQRSGAFGLSLRLEARRASLVCGRELEKQRERSELAYGVRGVFHRAGLLLLLVK